MGKVDEQRKWITKGDNEPRDDKGKWTSGGDKSSEKPTFKTERAARQAIGRAMKNSETIRYRMDRDKLTALPHESNGSWKVSVFGQSSSPLMAASEVEQMINDHIKGR